MRTEAPQPVLRQGDGGTALGEDPASILRISEGRARAGGGEGHRQHLRSDPDLRLVRGRSGQAAPRGGPAGYIQKLFRIV